MKQLLSFAVRDCDEHEEYQAPWPCIAALPLRGCAVRQKSLNFFILFPATGASVKYVPARVKEISGITLQTCSYSL